MGSLNLFAKPKMPKPQVVQQPNVNDTANQEALLLERKRRASATGSSGNITSSLVGALEDSQSRTRRSTLLGG